MTTYATLQRDIVDFARHSDINRVTPTLVRMCESTLNARLRSRFNVRVAVADVHADVLHLPADLAQIKRLVAIDSEGDERELLEGSGFWLDGEQIRLRQHQEDGTSARLTYWCVLQPLGEGNTSPPVLQQHYGMFLYGALMHTAPFLMDDARLQVWGDMFERELSAANARVGADVLQMEVI